MSKKRLFCERLSANDMQNVVGGSSTGGTTAGGASAGGSGGYFTCACCCACRPAGKAEPIVNSPCP